MDRKTCWNSVTAAMGACPGCDVCLPGRTAHQARRARAAFVPNREVAGMACDYCGGEAETWDHVIARANGGANARENRVPACRACNGMKGDMPVERFRSLFTAMEWAALGSRSLESRKGVILARIRERTNVAV